MDVYKELYKLFFYLRDRVDTKYLIAGVVFVILFIVMNLSSILWWGILLFLAYSFYKHRKSQTAMTDSSIEALCRKTPDLELCRMYEESKKKHADVLETIRAKL